MRSSWKPVGLLRFNFRLLKREKTFKNILFKRQLLISALLINSKFRIHLGRYNSLLKLTLFKKNNGYRYGQFAYRTKFMGSKIHINKK